jgi:hypothetical protein
MIKEMKNAEKELEAGRYGRVYDIQRWVPRQLD